MARSLVKNGVDTYLAVDGHETEQNRILKSDTMDKDSIQDDFCNKWGSIKHGFGGDRYSIYTNIIKKGDKKKIAPKFRRVPRPREIFKREDDSDETEEEEDEEPQAPSPPPAEVVGGSEPPATE